MRMKCVWFGFCLSTCGLIWAEAKSEPFRTVFKVISAPQIYATTWEEMLKRLDPHCTESRRTYEEQNKHGNVECTSAIEVDSFSVSTQLDHRVTMISASFFGVDKCLFMQKTLIRHFGKPTTAKDECTLEWWFRRQSGKPRRYASMEASSTEKKIYFSIGEEQGP